MHASSIIALALGASAVSAAAFPNVQVRDNSASYTFTNFPVYIDCPVPNGNKVTQQRLKDAVGNAKREGEPREKSAFNLATRHCGFPNFSGIPLWMTGIPDIKKPGMFLGSLSYALAPNGTFYFCGTTSGSTESGWPNQCTEHY
ncbi:hypothetical protein CFE70_009769 [Pyrenophora teres f. teres 0-1]|uniref:Uncharacterized protein n=2 Tax=Pyrenophora teres f. teres TaxID=97479 RepID=E3RNY1_PYRTT|nr:hypothetical protein PTT_10310 [Pyrenophora teres f. teres 0-1]KAE8827018.1 hypothetical protein HRS9139_08190 [Pyrenophora teres f. teres]KAE8832535.1 hypothetical protein PTNB85_06927 [Pyrenophora teres f. teres]KAE8856197.1 hypothetical protein PTNB29_09036 [Pyrenophora teres f. teres]KAK1911398.1 hypothetical protein P3342_012699 [Pyrenophora teres f. teres]